MIKDLKTTEMIKLINDGVLTNEEIAKQLGVSIPSFYNWKRFLIANGVKLPIRDKRFVYDRDSKLSKLVELSKEGIYTNRQLAVIIGIKQATLQSFKKELRNKGIELNSLKGRQTSEMKQKTKNITNLGILTDNT